MFSYIMLGTNDLPRAIGFYDPLMELLGHPKAGRGEEGASWGMFSENHTTGLCVGKPFDGQAAGVGNGTMVALNARSVEHIQQLHALALRLGARMKARRVTDHSMDKAFIAPMSEIPTAISWRLSTMQTNAEHILCNRLHRHCRGLGFPRPIRWRMQLTLVRRGPFQALPSSGLLRKTEIMRKRCWLS